MRIVWALVAVAIAVMVVETSAVQRSFGSSQGGRSSQSSRGSRGSSNGASSRGGSKRRSWGNKNAGGSSRGGKSAAGGGMGDMLKNLQGMMGGKGGKGGLGGLGGMMGKGGLAGMMGKGGLGGMMGGMLGGGGLPKGFNATQMKQKMERMALEERIAMEEAHIMFRLQTLVKQFSLLDRLDGLLAKSTDKGSRIKPCVCFSDLFKK